MPDPSERAITGGSARVKYIEAAMRGLICRFWLSGKPPSHLLDPLMGLTRAMLHAAWGGPAGHLISLRAWTHARLVAASLVRNNS